MDISIYKYTKLRAWAEFGDCMKRLKSIFNWEKVPFPAYILIKCSLVLSCFLLAVSLCIGVYAGELTADNVRWFRLYADLYRAPLGLMTLASLGALVINDALNK